MNEIKFRAWHKITKKHYMVSSLDWDYQYGLYRVVLSRVNEKRIPLPTLLNYDIIILEQYTGLKDKKGKEIYVGDIVNTHDDKDNPTLAVVTFKDACFRVDDIGNKGGYDEPLFNHNYNEYEIIGNIHEK